MSPYTLLFSFCTDRNSNCYHLLRLPRCESHWVEAEAVWVWGAEVPELGGVVQAELRSPQDWMLAGCGSGVYHTYLYGM